MVRPAQIVLASQLKANLFCKELSRYCLNTAVLHVIVIDTTDLMYFQIFTAKN